MLLGMLLRIMRIVLAGSSHVSLAFLLLRRLLRVVVIRAVLLRRLLLLAVCVRRHVPSEC
jgi:hypothetical protein